MGTNGQMFKIILTLISYMPHEWNQYENITPPRQPIFWLMNGIIFHVHTQKNYVQISINTFCIVIAITIAFYSLDKHICKKNISVT